MKFLLLFFLVLSLCSSPRAQAAAREDTMLMFVGEEEPVVTVASRYPESPATAPAVVTLVDREQIEQNGYRTLAELLADQPGFYMLSGGRGTVPYLRGLRDSILFLYDGVPMTTDVTKSSVALDREISLVAIDRVEIVRGAGSVLWGADAFAGVVNLVPRRAHKDQKFEIGLEGGNLETRGAHLALGFADNENDLFLTFSQLGSNAPNDQVTVDPQDETTNNSLDRSEYSELSGSLNIGHWLNLSGRWSDFSNHYTLQNAREDFRWPGTREIPFNYLKLSLQKQFGASHYRLSGYLSRIDYLLRDADTERQQRNLSQHLEFFVDHRLFSRGLVSLGASWRRNVVSNAVISDGFLPDFIENEENLFVPVIEQTDYTHRLYSTFGQFRYRWGKSEWWAGLRFDNHSQNRSALSYSVGFYYPINSKLAWKSVYGTAFRSPYSSQLFNNQHFKHEAVKTLSSQFSWKPTKISRIELSLFYSDISSHISEDPYGGLSLPESHQIYGGELSSRIAINHQFSTEMSFSLYRATSRQEDYRVLAFSFVRPDGTQEDIYEQWSQSADQGPRWLAGFGASWHIGEQHQARLNGRFAGQVDASYQKGSATETYDTPIQVDFTYVRPGFMLGKDSLTLRVTNLLNHRKPQPDVYGPGQTPPRCLSLSWNLRF